MAGDAWRVKPALISSEFRSALTPIYMPGQPGSAVVLMKAAWWGITLFALTASAEIVHL
jgi:hypothetical protein